MKSPNCILIFFLIVVSVVFSIAAAPVQAEISPSLSDIIQTDNKPEGILFTPYGYLLSYGGNNTIDLWNIKTGKRERTFYGMLKKIISIAVSNDQQYLAAGDDQGNLQIWDFEEGKLLHRIQAHKKTISAVTFSPDGKILATGSGDRTIRLWNVKLGRDVWRFSGHSATVHSLHFSRDGRTLFSGSHDKTIRVWDINSRKEKRSIVETAAKYGKMNTSEFSENFIAIGVTEVKKAGGSRRARAGRPVWSHLLKVRDLYTGEELVTFKGHLQAVTSVAVSTGNRYIASSSPDQTIRLWDMQNSSQLTTIPVNNEPLDVIFSPDGRLLASLDSNREIAIYELPGIDPVRMAPATRTANPVAGNLPAAKTTVGNTYAVIIGISKYASPDISPLEYTDDDARGVYEFLVSSAGGRVPRENITFLLNEEATLINVKKALGVFLAKKSRKNDTVIIYYAGHGAPEADMSGDADDGIAKYIVTYDADPEMLYATGFPMSEIRTIFKRIEADRIVFFLDSCYSGAAGGRTFLSSKLKARGLTLSRKFLDNAVSQGSGRVIITASRPNERSFEMDKFGHGIFTYHLLQALDGHADTNRDGVVALREAYDYLEEKVAGQAKEIGGNQHPMMIGEFSGKIILTRTVKE
ncbi:caspase family protein [Thermodesulfobacteriota bacterium]